MNVSERHFPSPCSLTQQVVSISSCVFLLTLSEENHCRNIKRETTETRFTYKQGTNKHIHAAPVFTSSTGTQLFPVDLDILGAASLLQLLHC